MLLVFQASSTNGVMEIYGRGNYVWKSMHNSSETKTLTESLIFSWFGQVLIFLAGDLSTDQSSIAKYSGDYCNF